jgi:hypothetical protein
MRAPLLLATALIGLAAPAQAQSLSATQPMPVTGNVPQICAMQRGQIQPGSALNVVGLDGDTLRIAQFVDPATLSVKAASATVRFEAVCNFAHVVRIESANNGLWQRDGRITQVPAGFAFAVPYTANVRWGPVTNQFSADAKTRRLAQQSFNIDTAVAGELDLRIEIAEGASNVEVDAPVVAGTYSDTVRIFLEPR